MSAIPLHLQKLTRINKGENVRSVARSDRIHAMQEIIKALVRGENIVTDRNDIRKRAGPGFVGLATVRRDSIGGGLGESFPFEIISRINPDSATLELGVINDSHLFNSEDKDTYEEDNRDWGLLDADAQQGWFTVTASDTGKKFWLKITLAKEDQSIAGIDLVYGFPGATGSWKQFPDPIEINVVNEIDPWQEFYFQIIGEISNPDIDPRAGSMILTIPDSNGTRIQVNQLLFNNIFMTTGHTDQDANEPDLPLLVTSAPYEPATDTGGTGTPIPSDSNLMTPWQFGPSVDVNDYSFKMFNVSTFPAAGNPNFRVLILDGDVINESDGSRHTPLGMGADNYVLPVADNGDEIWLVIPHDNEYNVVDPVTLNVGITTPNDTALVSYITIGQIFIDFNDEPPLLTPHNTVCGDVLFSRPSDLKSTRYSFQMFDASDDGGQKILIIDGDVIDHDDVIHTPAGMGQDNYILPVFDNSDIALVIPHDGQYNIIGDVTIGNYADTPDDTPTVSYITLGHINFNYNVSPATVDPTNSVCGDVHFDAPVEINNYSFKMVDASTGDIAQVRVMDGLVVDSEGNEFVPSGMGQDQLVLQANDGWHVFIEIKFNQNTGQILNVTVQTAPTTPFDIPLGNQYITIGQVYVDATQTGPFVLGVNHLCGDFQFDWDIKGQYAFQLFDGSLSDGTSVQPAVRIADGYVLDDYGNKVRPLGMGDDTRTQAVSDGQDVFLKIPIDDSMNRITGPITIEAGFGTPDDGGGFMYVTIGTAYVNQDGCFPVNAICGDFFIDPPVSRGNYDFQIEDASEGATPKVRIYDGVVIGPNDEPKDPTGMPFDNEFTINVNNDDEIWVGVLWDIEGDDGVSGDNIQSVWIDRGPATPDDNGLIQYITIGHVKVGIVSGNAVVNTFNETLGDIIIQYPPHLDSDELLQLSVDKDTGNVVWKTSKIATVTAEGTDFVGQSGDVSLDDIDVLTFDSADFSVWDGGGGQAVVTNANVLSISCGGTLVESVNDISLDSDLFTLTDNGGGSVDIGLQTTDCT